MKFHYDKDKDDRERVAAVLVDNGPSPKLLIKIDEGWACLYGEGHHTPNLWDTDSPYNYPVLREFYPGDKITIEF